jgi:hypothetical protein
VSALVPVATWVLSSLVLLFQNLFLGGWIFARWIMWLTWPLWASALGLGALSGFLSPR